ncbi:MAG: glycoside hydrolase family 1 protein [Ktedonobacterales bacterium]
MSGAIHTVGLAFPAGFRWGVATSSHQYEGGNTNNSWYAWERDGHIKSGDICGLACDWWNAAEADFDLAQQLGLNALRLSLEWSRIEPRPGKWDDAAIARYRAMLLALRARGIEPMVTLHHFTNPLWLEQRGAFLWPRAVAHFERYARFVVERLGDLCDFWCTINEPNVYAIVGYVVGDFPPGRRGAFGASVRVQGNLARAHAAAYHAIHTMQPRARVGWAQNFNSFDPARPRFAPDRWVATLQDTGFNEFFPRAMRTGRAGFPYRTISGDLSAVRDTCDFIGINVYYRDLVRFDLLNPGELFGRRVAAPDAPRGDQPVTGSWGEVYPAAIVRVAQRVAPLGKPIYVTENGVSDAADRLRPWQLALAVKSLHDALARGLDIRGYYHWSLIDNFEWAEGWHTRFGLAALDVKTQRRTLRRSGALYGAIAHGNALTPTMLAQYVPAALPEVFAQP